MTNHKVMPEELEDYQEESLESIQNGKNFLKSLENLPSEKIDSMMNEWDNLENNQEESKMNTSNTSKNTQLNNLGDKKIETIQYANSLNYLPEWGLWEILRELESNARDTGTIVKVYRDKLDLIIEDSGLGLNLRDLIIGEHTQKSDNSTIGTFGEGLKMSLLVAERLGIRIDIYTRDLHLWNSSNLLDSVKLLKIDYTSGNSPEFSGTQVIIRNWGKHSKEDYQERFLHPDNPMIIYQSDKGKIIKSSDDFSSVLFLKDIWINVTNFYFSYDILDAKINRDRNMLSQNDMLEKISAIYHSCDNLAIWLSFFQAIKQGRDEKYLNLSSWYTSERINQIIKKAFQALYGDKTLIGTDESLTRKCVHLGYKVINAFEFGNCARLLMAIIGTDKEKVLEVLNHTFNTVSSHKINEIQKANLGYLRKTIHRINRIYEDRNLNGFDFHYFDLKNLKLSDDLEFPGLTENGRIIYLHIDELKNLDTSINTFIHELAHVFSGASDLTDEHVNMITEITGLLLASYMNHDL